MGNFYLYIFAMAVFAMAFLGLFLGAIKGSVLNRLSSRIAVLIFISGPITLILIPISNNFINKIGLQNALLALVVYVLIALTVPIILSLLAVRFVRKPLYHFRDTVTSLKQSNYEIELQKTGISEFDEVFSEFNDLIHRLRHEEKLRKDLISDTSHELNTPLATMVGQLTAMEEGKLPLTKERITTLKEQTERLTDLVQQLNTYTKARMPSADKAEAIQLREFCDEFIQRFRLELEQKKITPEVDIADNYVVYATRSVLRQILTNLMQNTLRYSNATRLTIATKGDRLIFSDNGKGVPTEDLPYLFERFYRVEGSRNRATGGLGLGLAIVRELAERQGWMIDARHANPGISFVITLK